MLHLSTRKICSDNRDHIYLRVSRRSRARKMYKRASESAQQRLQSGRGKLSDAGQPTVRMTGPVPINKRGLKKAARLRKEREIAAAKAAGIDTNLTKRIRKI